MPPAILSPWNLSCAPPEFQISWLAWMNSYPPRSGYGVMFECETHSMQDCDFCQYSSFEHSANALHSGPAMGGNTHIIFLVTCYFHQNRKATYIVCFLNTQKPLDTKHHHWTTHFGTISPLRKTWICEENVHGEWIKIRSRSCVRPHRSSLVLTIFIISRSAGMPPIKATCATSKALRCVSFINEISHSQPTVEDCKSCDLWRDGMDKCALSWSEFYASSSE